MLLNITLGILLLLGTLVAVALHQSSDTTLASHEEREQ